MIWLEYGDAGWLDAVCDLCGQLLSDPGGGCAERSRADGLQGFAHHRPGERTDPT
jgi:hypothetical protein